jgi:hypothetical protein
MVMALAVKIAILFSGIFFLIGLISGAWKYVCIANSEKAKAPRYVDITHRSSLMYAFAALVIAKFAEFSPYPQWLTVSSVITQLFFFSFAILTYILHGILQDTQNQFKAPYQLGPIQLPAIFFHGSTWLLIIGELGGFCILFWGFIQTTLLK